MKNKTLTAVGHFTLKHYESKLATMDLITLLRYWKRLRKEQKNGKR